MNKLLIITGPTATGKTQFALDIASLVSGELISADSRQVYLETDIVTGKDIPPGFSKHTSDLVWHDRPLTYFSQGDVRIWLIDVVRLDEEFNVSFWKDCVDLIITDIHSRNKLPIVVGGTGLYIRALTEDLSQISIPHNPDIRQKLAGQNPIELFNYLKQLDMQKAQSLNDSDRHNPRRLLRAIEIAIYNHKASPSLRLREGIGVSYFREDDCLAIGLTAPKPKLVENISLRIDSRLAAGALLEAQNLLSKYPPDLPGMSACGYPALGSDNPRENWLKSEIQYLKRQLTWFKKMPSLTWFDITDCDWAKKATSLVNSWYNNLSA